MGVLLGLLLLAGLMTVCQVTGCSDSCENCHNGDRTSHPPLPTENVEVYQDGDDLIIRNRHVSVCYHLSIGTFTILDSTRSPVVLDAEALALSNPLFPKVTWHCTGSYSTDWHEEQTSTALGKGRSITVIRDGIPDLPWFEQCFTILHGQGCVISWVRIHNSTGGAIKVGALYPLSTDTPAGMLKFGSDQDLRVVTNGILNYIDFAVPMYPGTTWSYSNWSTLIYNQATHKSLSLGFLSFMKAQPIVFNAPARAPREGQILQAACQYDPPKTLAQGDTLTSETMILDVGQDNPFLALEGYADRLKTWLGITTWMDRHPESGVPAGWNSWSGSSSSGGYGTDINEEIIMRNMDFADRELRRWGMTYFQIDDGWQDATGDWGVNTARFPDHGDQNGIEWLLGEAKRRGFRTGLWIRAFDAEPDARIIEEHPDWFARPILGGLLDPDEHLLDLSNPHVQDHLVGLMERLRTWGIQWLKLDFAYRVMLSEDWYDPSLSRFEFYHNGIELLREALGEDVFFLNVAMAGPNYGLVDALRLTLDTMPVWEGTSENPYDPLAIIDNQGLKPMYRDAARRYYLQNRVWVNHPDLIFFRPHADPRIPALSLNESRTFASSVALQGGIVKIGDPLVDMSPEAVDSIRRILPVYGRCGRPLDMFRREFPEIWSLTLPDFAEPYNVLGLLNWGLNRDLTVLPPAWIPDEGRRIAVDLEEAGLDPSGTYLAFEFWEQKYLGEIRKELVVDVPARSPCVVALRRKLGRPQLLGTNRHVLGGVGVIRSVEWDPYVAALTGTQEGSVGTAYVPFAHQVTIYVPEGFIPSESHVSAPEGYRIDGKSLSIDGCVATLRFVVTELPGACSSGEVCRHPDVTWSMTFK